MRIVGVGWRGLAWAGVGRLGWPDDARPGLAGKSRRVREAGLASRRKRLPVGAGGGVDGAALALSSFRIAADGTGETTLAKGLWETVPDNSLVMFDRGVLIKGQLVRVETLGNRHWRPRRKSNTRWAVVAHLGRNDDLVELDINEPHMPKTWQIRAIRYCRRGFPPSTILTSLVDAEAYPAKELIALYHAR